jgi:hypothetical protein
MIDTEADTTRPGGPEQPEDGTLGGYLRMHNRPPAFGGLDGHPYTVSVEIETTANLRAPYIGYLVFPRWGQTGLGIIGHVSSPSIVECRSAREAEERLGALTLGEVRELLDQALRGSEG